MIRDRGSRYAVSGAPCSTHQEAALLVERLRRYSKKFSKATHHSWALVAGRHVHKHDDGETGAGLVIARVLERAGALHHLVIVTRWYGGKRLGGDRFRHVQNAVGYYLAAVGLAGTG